MESVDDFDLDPKYTLDEFRGLVRGRRIIKSRLGDDGFDIVFDNGVVLETYDGCRILKKLVETLSNSGKIYEDCEELTRDDHKKILDALAGRTVVDVEVNVDDCLVRFTLDDGNVVCVPDRYYYCIDHDYDDEEE